MVFYICKRCTKVSQLSLQDNDDVDGDVVTTVVCKGCEMAGDQTAMIDSDVDECNGVPILEFYLSDLYEIMTEHCYRTHEQMLYAVKDGLIVEANALMAAQLTENDKQLENANRKCLKMEQDIAAEEVDATCMSEQMQIMANQILQLEETVHTLKQEIMSKDEEIISLELDSNEMYSKLNEDIMSLEMDLTEAWDLNTEQTQKVNKLESENVKLEQDLASEEVDVTCKTEHMELMTNHILQLEETVQGLNLEIIELELDSNEMHSKNAQLEQDLASEEVDVTCKSEHIELMTNQILQLEETVQGLNLEIIELELDSNEMHSKNEQLEQDLAAEEVDVTCRSEQIELMASHILQLEETVQGLNLEIIELELDSNEMHSKNEKLEQDLVAEEVSGTYKSEEMDLISNQFLQLFCRYIH